MINHCLAVICGGILAAVLAGCSSAPSNDRIYQKREKNIKQSYSEKLDLLQKENEQLQVRISELTANIGKLGDQLKLARESAEALAQAKKPAANTANNTDGNDNLARTETKTESKTELKCRILSVNERLNLIIISAGSTQGVKSKNEYNVIFQGKSVGWIRIDQAEVDWASAALIRGGTMVRLKELDGEVILSGE
ncbi:MAG: hypothetical protein WC980_05190 [Candidatus Brocadiia bacterium]